MYLTEIKIIRDKEFYKVIDECCANCSRLYNTTNYNINQISRIGNKMKQGIKLEPWEDAYIEKVNKGIEHYNHSGRTEKNLKPIGKDRTAMTDFYFLNWYMRGTSYLYESLPLIISGQKVIEELCNAWTSYYKLLEKYKAGKLRVRPQKPGYKDKKRGRVDFVIPHSGFKHINNKIILSKRLNKYQIKTNKQNVKQIRLITENGYIKVKIIYQIEEQTAKQDNGRYFSIDLGVNNLMTVVSNIRGIEPFILNGKPIKAINQYYYKTNAKYQSIGKRVNSVETTKRLARLSDKRRRKIDDYFHKVTKIVIDKAVENDICKIIVGKNTNWKANCKLGKTSNQNFMSIPYTRLLKMLEYKGRLQGIEVIQVEERYTSGTSYVDGEQPIKENYNKKRRVKRGLFKTKEGITINADVNGAYQIMKKVRLKTRLYYKGQERVERIRNAA